MISAPKQLIHQWHRQKWWRHRSSGSSSLPVLLQCVEGHTAMPATPGTPDTPCSVEWNTVCCLGFRMISQGVFFQAHECPNVFGRRSFSWPPCNAKGSRPKSSSENMTGNVPQLDITTKKSWSQETRIPFEKVTWKNNTSTLQNQSMKHDETCSSRLHKIPIPLQSHSNLEFEWWPSKNMQPFPLLTCVAKRNWLLLDAQAFRSKDNTTASCNEVVAWKGIMRNLHSPTSGAGKILFDFGSPNRASKWADQASIHTS